MDIIDKTFKEMQQDKLTPEKTLTELQMCLTFVVSTEITHINIAGFKVHCFPDNVLTAPITELPENFLDFYS